MGQPGKVLKNESPILGVSPAHLHDARCRQLPGHVGFPISELRGAPHKAWLFWGDPGDLYVSPPSTEIPSAAHFSSFGFCMEPTQGEQKARSPGFWKILGPKPWDLK